MICRMFLLLLTGVLVLFSMTISKCLAVQLGEKNLSCIVTEVCIIGRVQFLQLQFVCHIML